MNNSNLNFNYEMLIESINRNYKGEKIEYKINKFCKDSKIKIYRFRRIIEAKAYFQSDEIYRIINLLGIKIDEISDYFFKLI